MTVLGLRLSRRANAVSSLHGEVSREMWTGLFPGKPEEAVPIGHITNGVHVPTWLAPQMFQLYDRHLGTGWHERSGEAKTWDGIEDIDDGELWETHMSLKARMLEFVRRRAGEQAVAPAGKSADSAKSGKVLSPDALTIGFARRFATYKRANLLLRDIERLAAMVNDPKRPVQFVFAGKAHPLDEPGKRVLQQIAQLMRDSQFGDRFVFVEDYDINVGRYLRAGSRCLAEQSATSAGSFRHQRPESGLERRPESFRSRWLVGGGLRRHERLRHRHRQNPLQYGRPRHAAMEKTCTARCAKK